MLRVVAFKKATVAGLAGAGAMELCWLAGSRAGLPVTRLGGELSSLFSRYFPFGASFAAASN